MRRVTVTLPEDIVDDIDRREVNRSRFVTEAVIRELERRRYQEFQKSIRNPHPESVGVAEAGVTEWGAQAGEDDEVLLDLRSGHDIQWVPGTGWTEPEE